MYPGVTLVKIHDNEILSDQENISRNSYLDSLSEHPALPQGGTSVPKIPITNSDLRTEETLSQGSNGTMGLNSVAATASLTITSKTATSITFNVVYPTSGANYNMIALWDFNQGASIFPTADFAGNNKRTNGTYTISGLVSGGMYQIVMMWASPNGQYYGGEYSIFRKALLPFNTTETLTRNDGTYVFSNIETADKASASTSNFNTWISRMDSAYLALQALTGRTPYNGGKIELRSTREDMNTYSPDGQNYWYLTWGWSGNPSRIAEWHYKSLMKRLANGDWGDCPIHEMSHDFDIDAWNFDPEVLSDFKEYYVVEQLGAKVYRLDTEKYYTGSAFYNFFKTDQWESYDNTFAQGYYSSRGLTAVLMRLKNTIGWEAFKKTFQDYKYLSPQDLQNTTAGKFNMFMTLLKENSGSDVLSMMTSSEKNICSSYFGGTIKYLDIYPISEGGATEDTQEKIFYLDVFAKSPQNDFLEQDNLEINLIDQTQQDNEFFLVSDEEISMNFSDEGETVQGRVLLKPKYNSSTQKLRFSVNVDEFNHIFIKPIITKLKVTLSTSNTENGPYTQIATQTWNNCSYILDYSLPDQTAQTKYYKFDFEVWFDGQQIDLAGGDTHTWLINRTGHFWHDSWEIKDTLSGKKITKPSANYTYGYVASRTYDYRTFYKKEYDKKYSTNLDLTGYEVHHIKPLNYGGDHSFDNLIHLKVADHKKITSWFAGY